MHNKIARRFVSVLTGAALLVGGQMVTAESFSGAYLAAVQADIRNDYVASSRYYSEALQRDPQNVLLLQSTMVAHIAAGNVDAAVTVARAMQHAEPDNQIIGLVLLADALSANDFEAAKDVVATEGYDLNPLLADLSKGWIELGLGNADAASAQFEAMQSNDALQIYGQYHNALSLALLGNFADARIAMEDGPDGPLHLSRTAIVAHVAILSELDANEAAIAVIDDALSGGFSDIELEAMRTRLQAGEKISFSTVSGPADGIADAFIVLASALNRENAERFGLLYARLAVHIRPDFDEAILTAGDILVTQQQLDLAIKTYNTVSAESPWFNSAEIGRANALNASERTDAAIEVLENLAKQNPGDLGIQTSLADTLRGSERFEEAAVVYDRAIALLGEENSNHWVLYYSRGISFERTDQWEKAEADFRHALELQPDQALVLNYLGYSLVELGQNLEEAQEMIEKAVAARPNDGFITDSLGWVLYRVGKFEEAVPYMERAVELTPIDPILNDHLGDVLWKVGRLREAEFQWKRALSFEPEEEDADRIRRKLEVGLDVVLEEEADELSQGAANLQDG